MLIVALTGGIGSGKSTVTALFAQLGVPIIDADQLAHELVEPGEEALGEITSNFGETILTADGRLNRPRLRKIIFDDPEQKAILEAILHPRIRAAIQRRLSAINAPYALLVVPLLFEAGGYDFVDHTIVVDCNEQLQLERTLQRDDSAPGTVEAMIASQWPRQRRLAAADSVIDNSGMPAELVSQVEGLHAKLLRLAEAKP